MWLCLFPRVGSSAVPVLPPAVTLRNVLRRIYPTVWSPLRKNWALVLRPVTVTLLRFHLWTPPAHLHHLAPYLPDQPVRASDCSIGQTAVPPVKQKRLSPPQACPPCSSFSLKRRVLHLLRPSNPLEKHPRCVHPLLRETFQTPHLHRTVPTSPSPSLTLVPSAKSKTPATVYLPPTRRRQQWYVHVFLEIYRSLWLGRLSECTPIYFGNMASCTSSGNEFK